ncbi:hypothetical protein LPB67_12290 [Undibacterium sp. Jales W-56]|uniref:hypothetical protein n=1 Tax=Undibacterium sp. Jales W-56 TaxID=2897325 RepID=UPI0021D32D60|nr:hypothetical protein [Undibacterium sp. Jales W-56]MCU6434551.1 hypothetical protein [Undibacterium sp. Jales W-56]
MRKNIQASLIHLSVSVSIVSLVLLFTLLVCYPTPYFHAMGVKNILVILAIADITIGPIITLIIYDPLKRLIKFDLAVVAILQLIALGYGVSTILAGRPVYVVYFEDRFILESAFDIPKVELDKVNTSMLPFTGPRIVAVQLPKDKTKLKSLIQEGASQSKWLPQMPSLFIPYASVAENVKSKLKELDELRFSQPTETLDSMEEEVTEALTINMLKREEVGFIPVEGQTTNLTALIKKSDASVIRIIVVDPFIKKTSKNLNIN